MNSTVPPLHILLTGVVVAAIMYFAGDVLIPLALATLLSFVLAVPVSGLEKIGAPRSVAVVVVVAAAFGAIFALGQILEQEVSDLAGRLPQYEANIGEKIDALRPTTTSRTLEPARGVLRALDQEFNAGRPQSSATDIGAGTAQARRDLTKGDSRLLDLPVAWLVALVAPLLGPLVITTLAFIFVVFMLIQREDLRNRLVRLAGSTDIAHTTAALDEAARRLSRLFLTQSVINSIYGAIIGLGLFWIGVPSAFVWGVLTGALRFIPYIGPVLALILPLTLSVAVGSGWSMALWTLALYAGLESVTGNAIEPLFEGRTTGLTPIAIVVAALFWWRIWGTIGLVMSTPLTVILVALGRHFEALKPFDILLGDTPALSDPEALYRSMLAGNLAEAMAQAKSYMATRTLSGYCDAVARPVLVFAQTDLRRGALEGKALAAFQASFARLFEEIARRRWALGGEAREHAQAPLVRTFVNSERTARPAESALLVSLGGPGALDDAAAVVITALAQAHGLRAVTVGKPAKLDLSEAEFVCVSSLDDASNPALAKETQRIRTEAPRIKLVLGVWGVSDDTAVESMKGATGADMAFRSFQAAAAAMLGETAHEHCGDTAAQIRPAVDPTTAEADHGGRG